MASVPTLFTNARVFDGVNTLDSDSASVLVRNGIIEEVSLSPIRDNGAHVVDVEGRTLLPGLIDAHFHAYASDVSVHVLDAHPVSYGALHGARVLRHALDCGFTTVRDVGGGEIGIARAIEDGLIAGPRYFYAGKILGMTGGHADWRYPHEGGPGEVGSCRLQNRLCHIVDGPDACRAAAREELRKGAHCIKIMGSGGVASPTDPLWLEEYTGAEVQAVVEEAARRRRYVAAHCHPPGAARRCADFGVRSIEHGTLMDESTAMHIAVKGAFVVPTLAIIFSLVENGQSLGLPSESQAKVIEVSQHALRGLEIMARAGVKMGFGTDLMGKLYLDQCREFALRRQVLPALEILRSATSVNADLMQLSGWIGRISHGAHADLLVADGDPLADLGVLAQDGRGLSIIMQHGAFYKNTLS